MADARVRRRQACHLVHELRARERGLVIPHAAHDVGEHLGIQARARRAVHRLAHALHATLGVGERAFLLRIAATRQDDIGVLRRLRHEQLLAHEEVQRLQRADDMARVRVGAHRVLAEQEQAADAPVDHGGEALGGFQARRLVQLDTPCRLELRAHLGVGHLLIARKVRRARAHVACALHVVLAAQRVDAAAGTAVFAGHHGDVGERHHAFGARRVLGDA